MTAYAGQTTFISGDPIFVDYTPGSAVSAGQVVVQNNVPFVAHADIAASTLGHLAAGNGIYQCACNAAIAAGKAVWWDDTNNRVTETSTSNTFFGFTFAASFSSNTKVYVVHDPAVSVSSNSIAVTVALAAGASNSFNATITVVDSAGTAIAAVHDLEVYISRSAIGAGLTSTAASGALTASTGTVLTALTAKKHITAVTDANGVLVLNLVDSAKTEGEYVVIKNPMNGRLHVSAATVTATYG